MILIKEVSSREDMANAWRIRESVLEAEQGFAHDVNIDGKDESATHVLILDDKTPVATARLTIVENGEALIARIAVRSTHRGIGLGRSLIFELERMAKRDGLHTTYVEPFANLEPFFVSLGYERIGGPIVSGRHELIRLRKRL